MPTIVSDVDAERMFISCVCQYEGQLVLPWGIRGDSTMASTLLSTGKDVDVPQDADLLTSPTDFRLGYLQLGGDARFLQRVPNRTTRVGWHERSIRGFPAAAEIRRSKSVREAIMRMATTEYIPFAKAVEGAVKNGSVLAFDRQWAINQEQQLKFKGRTVGRLDDGVVRMSREYAFLREELEKLCA